MKLKTSLTAIIKRTPFTLVTLAILVVAALLTNTQANSLPHHVLNRLGYSASDLLNWRWWRLFTSAFLTDGGVSFWEAIIMVCFSVGLAEWRSGTLRTGLTFWGVHLTTLIIEGYLVTTPLFHLVEIPGLPLTMVRDVGPSAGYFACLALAIATLRKPWSWIGFWGIFSILMAVFLFPIGTGHKLDLSILDNLAHVIAFPLGWLSWKIKRPIHPSANSQVFLNHPENNSVK